MKNKQLFIMSLLMVAGGMSFASTVEMKKVKTPVFIGLDQLERSQDGSTRISFICNKCTENFTADCRELDDYLSLVKDFNYQVRLIETLELTLSELPSGSKSKALMEEKLAEVKAVCPGFEGSFKKTISKQTQKAFDKAFKQVANDATKGTDYVRAIQEIAKDEQRINEIIGN